MTGSQTASHAKSDASAKPARSDAHESFNSFAPRKWTGDCTGVEATGGFVARTDAEWKDMWRAHCANMGKAPRAPKLPEGMMAVAIFPGVQYQPTEMKISYLIEGRYGLEVCWQRKATEDRAAIARPFLIQWVGKTDRPVFFSEYTPDRACPKAAGPLSTKAKFKRGA